jgi:hypothetical protein
MKRILLRCEFLAVAFLCISIQSSAWADSHYWGDQAPNNSFAISQVNLDHILIFRDYSVVQLAPTQSDLKRAEEAGDSVDPSIKALIAQGKYFQESLRPIINDKFVRENAPTKGIWQSRLWRWESLLTNSQLDPKNLVAQNSTTGVSKLLPKYFSEHLEKWDLPQYNCMKTAAVLIVPEFAPIPFMYSDPLLLMSPEFSETQLGKLYDSKRPNSAENLTKAMAGLSKQLGLDGHKPMFEADTGIETGTILHNLTFYESGMGSGPGYHEVNHVVTVLGVLVEDKPDGSLRIKDLLVIEKDNPGLYAVKISTLSSIRSRGAFKSNFDFVYSPLRTNLK